MKTPRSVGWGRFFLGLGLAAVALLIVARALGPLSQLVETARHVSWRWLLVAALTASAMVPLAALRMRWSLRVQDDQVSYARCVIAVLAASPVGAVLPARLGDFFRAAVVLDRVPLARALSSIVAEKVVDLTVIFSAALLGAMFAGYPSLAVGCGIVLLIVAAPVLITGLEHLLLPLPGGSVLVGRIAPLLMATRLLKRKPGLSSLMILSSMLGLTLSCLHLVILLRAAGAHMPLEVVVRCLPLAMIAGGLPLTPSGLGTRDAAFMALIDAQYREPSVLVATLLYALTQWVFALVGFPWFLKTGLSVRASR